MGTMLHAVLENGCGRLDSPVKFLSSLIGVLPERLLCSVRMPSAAGVDGFALGKCILLGC